MVRLVLVSSVFVALLGLPAVWLGAAFTGQVIFAMVLVALFLTFLHALIVGQRKQGH